MKLSLLLLIAFLSINSVLGYEVEGVLKNIGSSSTVTEGESFDAQIDIWPMAEDSLESIQASVENKIFLDYFYIGRVSNIRYSENNSEVVIVNAKVVLVKSYESKSVFIWTYKSLTIPFNLKNVSPQSNEIGKDFIILNQQDGFLDRKFNLWAILIVVAIFLLLSFIAIKKAIVVRGSRLKSQRIKEEWNKLFLAASDREAVENIYKFRNKWLDIIGGETPPIINFFEELDSVQYKKDWSDIEEHKVLEAFDDIRGIFGRA